MDSYEGEAYEAQRISELHSYEILDTLPTKDFDDLTSLASLICNVPIAMVSLIDENRQWFKSRIGLSTTQTLRTHSFCSYAINSPGELMIVEDAHADNRFKDNPLVTGEPYITFYAGMPLVTEDGYALGSLCVIDQKKRTLSQEQKEALQTISRQVMEKLELRRNNLKLERLNHRLKTTEDARQTAQDDLQTATDKWQQSNNDLEALYTRQAIIDKQVRIAAESAHFGMWDLNLQTGDLVVSDNMKTMYGFATTDVVTLDQFLSVSGEADQKALQHIVEQATDAGTPAIIEFQITNRETGKLKWMRAVGEVHRDAEGRPWRLAGMTVDITEEKQSKQIISHLNDDLQLSIQKLSEQEETLRLAIQSADIGLWQIDLNNNATTLSDRMKSIHGMPLNQDITFDQALSTVMEEYRQSVNEQVLTAVETGEPFVADYKINRMDGSGTGWVHSTGIVTTSKDGSRRILIGACMDITEQKELQQRKDDFISIASHELRTPVAGLKSCVYLLDWLKENPESDMLPEVLEQTSYGINRLSRLTDNLLNATRLQQGQLALNKSVFKVSALFASCCRELQTASGQEVQWQGDPDLTVEADELQMGQVLFNFLSNARKYAPESKTILVKAEKNREHITLSVRDEGRGIKPEELPHLFDRYYRSEHSSRQYSGLGLGLYICAEIVKLHGGKIWAESEQGKGSTFFFTIPDV